MAVNMQELQKEYDRRGIKIEKLEQVIKELEEKIKTPKHTPREIVEQCKLRWEISLEDLADTDCLSLHDETATGKEMEELMQWIAAAVCILDEFRLEGI